jgi:hypothetical protein
MTAPVRSARNDSWLERHARLVGLLVFVALSFLWFASVWSDPTHRHAGQLGDPDAYIFAIAWPPFAMAHHMNPFFSTYLLAPTGANLMWSIPPGFGLLLWPLTATLGPVFSYNVLATLSLAFSAWTAQLALRRFVPGELGPFAGGLFYGFSPYMTVHSAAHAMLTVAILPPLLLLLFHETFVRQRWRPAVTGLAIGALLAFQISTFLELLAGGAVAAIILIVIVCVMYREEIRARFRYVAAAAATAVISFFVLSGYQLWTLLFGIRSLLHTHQLLHPQNAAVTDVFGFVVPTKFNAFTPTFVTHFVNHFSVKELELNGFIGLPLLIICVVVAVKHWNAASVRIASIMTFAMALLSMGPRFQVRGTSTIPLPWILIEKLPLMGNLLPVRLSVFTDLGIGFLLAYGIAFRAKPANRSQKTLRVVAAAAVVITMIPSQYLLKRLSAPATAPTYFTSSDVKRIPEGSIALVAPWTTDASNIGPELWQVLADFRFRLASGYAYVPLAHGRVSSGLLTDDLEADMYRINIGIKPPDLHQPGVREHLVQLVKKHRISTVIVGPMLHQPAMLRYLTGVLGRPPEQSGGVYVWYRVGAS